MVLSRKKPVELTIEIQNNTPEIKLLSMEMAIAKGLSLDKAGLKSGEKKQLGSINLGETKRVYYNIYPKQMAKPNEYPLKIRVLEHHGDYSYVLNTITRDDSIIVDA